MSEAKNSPDDSINCINCNPKQSKMTKYEKSKQEIIDELIKCKNNGKISKRFSTTTKGFAEKNNKATICDTCNAVLYFQEIYYQIHETDFVYCIVCQFDKQSKPFVTGKQSYQYLLAHIQTHCIHN